MDKPQAPFIGMEALLFLGLILLPYFGISFFLQWILFACIKRHMAPSVSELIAAHGMSFLLSIVVIMIFMHYADSFEPLFALIPLINSVAQIFFYHKPYHSFLKVSLIVLLANGIAAIIDALFIFYCFGWIMNTIF